MIEEGGSEEAARSRFYLLASRGLLIDDDAAQIRDFQRPYARPSAEVSDWQRTGKHGGIVLEEVVRQVRPTILIGTSTQTGAFNRGRRHHHGRRRRASDHPAAVEPHRVERSRSERSDALDQRPGTRRHRQPIPARAHNGRTYQIAQANNALIFPGLGLGVTVFRAEPRAMERSPPPRPRSLAFPTPPNRALPLPPPVTGLRSVSAAVATAVAEQHTPRAWPENLSTTTPPDR